MSANYITLAQSIKSAKKGVFFNDFYNVYVSDTVTVSINVLLKTPSFKTYTYAVLQDKCTN